MFLAVSTATGGGRCRHGFGRFVFSGFITHLQALGFPGGIALSASRRVHHPKTVVRQSPIRYAASAGLGIDGRAGSLWRGNLPRLFEVKWM